MGADGFDTRKQQLTQAAMIVVAQAIQRKASAAAMVGFARRDHVIVIMATGSGKTFVIPHVIKGCDAKRTLVLVPNQSLLKQTSDDLSISKEHH